MLSKSVVKSYRYLLVTMAVGYLAMLISLAAVLEHIDADAKTLASETAGLQLHPFKVNKAALEAKFAAAAINNELLNAVGYHRNTGYSGLLERVGKLDDALDASLGTVEVNFLGDQAKVGEAKDLLRVWRNEREEVVGLLDGGFGPEAERYFQAHSLPIYAKVIEALDYVIEFSTVKATAYVDASRSQSLEIHKHFRRLLIGYSVFSLLAGVVTAFVAITALLRRDEQLARDHERIRVMADTVDGFSTFLLDAEGRVSTWNDGARRMKGYYAEDIIGEPIDRFYTPEDISVGKPAMILQHARDTGICKDVGWRVRKDGSRFWGDVIVSPLKDASSVVLGFIKITRDITERKESEERIASLSRLYQTRSAIDQAIVRIPSHEELFNLACRYAVDAGGMMMAFVSLHSDGSQMFRPVARYGDQLDYVDQIRVSSNGDEPDGRGPIGTAFRENRPVIVNDYENSPMTMPWHQNGRTRGWRSAAAFPILRGEAPFAVISIYSHQLNAFTSEIINELNEMVRSISFALDNRDREDERKTVEDELLLAALVYETSNEAMVVTDPLGTIITINPAFTKVTGYTSEEVVGKKIGILKSGRQDEAFYRDMWAVINATGQWMGEIWNRKKNGDIYPEWLSISSVYREGSPHRRVALFSDITDYKKSQEMIWQQANFDSLTSLPNRRMFLERLDQEIKKSRRTELPLALLFVDLDHFKEINDTLGHDCGDILLQGAALRLRSCVRETDLVGRLGGDEFTVALVDLEDISSVDRIAEDILHKVAGAYTLGDQVAYISGSIGITLYPNDAQDAQGLLKNADQAMYEAKHLGRNRYNYFETSM